jgi:hypothetical protein
MHLRFSQDLIALLQRLARQPLTLGAILDETAERGFGVLIALLVLPFLLPLPPGLTGVAGTVCLLLSLQMARGQRTPWLPHRLKRVVFSPALSRSLLHHMQGLTHWLERLTRPRLRPLTAHPLIWRINGLCITWLTLLLIAPIPLTNPIPTIGILLLVVAMLESDGVLMCVAYGLIVVITLTCIGIGWVVWQGVGGLLPG